MTYVTEDGMALMACPDPGCPSDDGGGFWVELEEETVDDHFGGHTVRVLPEEATCPACGRDGVPVEEGEA